MVEVALVDVNTDSPSVMTTLNNWVSGLIKEYQIDGLRLDGMSQSTRKNPGHVIDLAFTPP